LKRLLYLAILSTAAMLISAPAASAQDEMTVSIQDFFFDPDQLNVAPGTTVTWVNKGQAPHTVTSTDGKELDSATLQPGDTYSFTFKDDDAGETYAYQCTIHPQMTASVNVSGGGGTTSSASASMSTSASASASVSPKMPETGGVPLPLLAAVALVGSGILAMIAMRRVS
jgi:plastocyanin